MPDRRVHLIVRSPFRDHSEGDRITDPKLVTEILAGEHALHVMQTPAPDDEPPVENQRGRK